MERSETISELAGALAKAQGEFSHASMNAENPFLKNKYADLGSIIQASRPALTKYGLSIVQTVSGSAGEIHLETTLLHSSGEWLSSILSVAIGEARGKSQVQEMGSNITYLRRYSMASMLGIYADEDTDGNEQKEAGRSTQTNKPSTQTNKIENPAPKPEAPAAPVDDAALLAAMNEVNSQGELYGSLPTEKLALMSNALRKTLSGSALSADDRAEKERKHAAIKLILDSRQPK